jgi:hypothetical protein
MPEPYPWWCQRYPEDGFQSQFAGCPLLLRSLVERKEHVMTPAFRRTAGRVAAATLATAALTTAAIAGGQAATASTTCEPSPLAETFNAVLSLRNASSSETPKTPTCR